MSSVPHGTTETVSGRFRTNEPLRLTATVTLNGSTHRLAILRTSTLAGIRLKRTTTTWNAAAGRAGSFDFRLIMERHALKRDRTYLMHLTATNSRGAKVKLTIRFRPA